MNPQLDAVFFKGIPHRPGVYFMLGRAGEILYIGKAKDLKNRLAYYRRARRGMAPENIVEMVESLHSIRWELHRSEKAALEREYELLHAIRPPFNIADTWPGYYLFVGLRYGAAIDFQLTDEPGKVPGYRVYGCFKHRYATKAGYNALLRLAYAATQASPRFFYPAVITRSTPAYRYRMKLPPAWIPELERFLEGKSLGLLRTLVGALLENDSLPAFMRPSLQDDIETVRDFYRLGPASTARLKREQGIREAVLSCGQMDRMILRSLEAPIRGRGGDRS